jgi:hypothetical protein
VGVSAMKMRQVKILACHSVIYSFLCFAAIPTFLEFFIACNWRIQLNGTGDYRLAIFPSSSYTLYIDAQDKGNVRRGSMRLLSDHQARDQRDSN